MSEYNQSVESRVPKTASAEEKLADIVEQLKNKYPDRVFYSIKDLENDNPKIKLSTITSWTKKLFGVTAFDYLVTQGIMKRPVFFDLQEEMISLDDLNGKRLAFPTYHHFDSFAKQCIRSLGAIIEWDDGQSPDYVIVTRRIQKEPEPDRWDMEAYTLLKKRDDGEFHFTVLPWDFVCILNDYIQQQYD